MPRAGAKSPKASKAAKQTKPTKPAPARGRRRGRQRLAAAAADWESSPGPRTVRLLAQAHLEGGSVGEALQVLEAHPAWRAADPALQRTWAIALRRAERWDDAAAAFETLATMTEALEQSREAGEAPVWARPPGAGSTAHWARAEALHCRLRGEPPGEAAEVVRRLLLLPSFAANPHALALHGRLLAQADRGSEAVGPLLRATEAVPGDSSVAAAAAFAVRRVRGEREAMPLLMRALRIRPDQPAVLAALVADAVRCRRVAITRKFLMGLATAAPEPGPLWNAVRRLARLAEAPAKSPEGARREAQP